MGSVLFVSERQPVRATLLMVLDAVLHEKGWQDFEIVSRRYADVLEELKEPKFELVVVDVVLNEHLIQDTVRLLAASFCADRILGFIGHTSWAYKGMPERLGFERCLMLSTERVDIEDGYRKFFRTYVPSFSQDDVHIEEELESVS